MKLPLSRQKKFLQLFTIDSVTLNKVKENNGTVASKFLFLNGG